MNYFRIKKLILLYVSIRAAWSTACDNTLDIGIVQYPIGGHAMEITRLVLNTLIDKYSLVAITDLANNVSWNITKNMIDTGDLQIIRNKVKTQLSLEEVGRHTALLSWNSIIKDQISIKDSIDDIKFTILSDTIPIHFLNVDITGMVRSAQIYWIYMIGEIIGTSIEHDKIISYYGIIDLWRPEVHPQILSPYLQYVDSLAILVSKYIGVSFETLIKRIESYDI